VRRDLLLRHDRTVHAKDGGPPLQSEPRRRSAKNQDTYAHQTAAPAIDAASLDSLDGGVDGLDDLEAAGMLLRDFHHKAMASQEPEQMQMPENVPPVPTIQDTTGAYMHSQHSMVGMHWDGFLPPGPKSHSISSTGSADQYGQNNPPPLPPIMERQMSGSDTMMPSFQSLHNSLPVSGLGTPGALSPYPSMLGPVSPVDYRRSPGPSQALMVAKAPQIENEEHCLRIWENIKNADTEHALLETFRLPALAVLNRYLSTYFHLFHHHLPFLHPASFNPVTTSPPLLLAVLSIGALYTFEQDSAYMLHIGSKVLVNQFLQNKENFSSRKCPLWTMQSTLLNMIFASWSGDAKGLEWACSIKSLLANVRF
jgi:hypothetical protein